MPPLYQSTWPPVTRASFGAQSLRHCRGIPYTTGEYQLEPSPLGHGVSLAPQSRL